MTQLGSKNLTALVFNNNPAPLSSTTPPALKISNCTFSFLPCVKAYVTKK
uniref:Uncharacterized protein n=1 Tax=Rhizophora mucronata TaxID=61149 RepID=A0A2P2R2B7_RHIMU